MEPALAQYVCNRVQAGTSKTQIREELLAVGWSEEEADSAYRDGLIALGIPVPREPVRPTAGKGSSTADIVLNFFSFILLAIVSTALGTLYFQIINKSIPDPLAVITAGHGLTATRSIHHAIASLVIVFPLYVISMWAWFRRFRQQEGRVESKLTKWLTYLILLIASTTIVGDLITVVFMLLQGEFTVRFLLKALVILVIATTIFGFYYIERREIQYHKSLGPAALRYIGGAVTALVVLGIVTGFYTAGSPETARKQAFDNERSRQLGLLAGCIQRYASEFGELPASLERLGHASRYSNCTRWTRDPQTRREFPYRVVTASKPQGSARVGEFELCAEFSLPNSALDVRPAYGAASSIWNTHGTGRTCHTVTAKLGEINH